MAYNNADAAATSAVAGVWFSTACIADLTLGTNTIDFVADCTTFASGANSDQVIITPSNAPTVTTRVFWTAYGGTDITNAKAGSFAMSAGAGPTSTTDPGFQPNAVILAGRSTVQASGAVSTSFAGMLGAASSTTATDQAVTAIGSCQAAATMHDAARQLTDRCVAYHILGTSSVTDQGSAHVSSWDATGFTLTHDVSIPSAYNLCYLAFGGTAQWKVISETQKTSTGTQAKTGVGFQPTALPLVVSANMVASSSIVGTSAGTEANLLGFTVGSYDGTTTGMTWIGEQDNNTASLSAQRQSTALVLATATGTNVVATGSSTTFASTATVSSLNADGFTMNWATADATARQFWVLAVAGAAAAAAKAPPRSSQVLRQRYLLAR